MVRHSLVRSLFALCLILLGGCAHRWEGDKPNFKLSGEAARQEIDAFSFYQETVFTQKGGYRVGPSERLYSFESLYPMIKEATPEIASDAWDIRKARSQNRLLGLGSLLVFFLGSTLPGDAERHTMQLAGLAGAAIWVGREAWIHWQMVQLAPAYNQELQNRFAPRLTFSRRF